MKSLPIAIAALLCFYSDTIARPQLHTESIGWINPSDIECEATSDHICVGKEFACGYCATFAFTFTDPVSGSENYQVHGGTLQVILDDRGNDLFYHSEKSKGRVEVAIVIPSDWDDRRGHEAELRPDKPCRLKTSGNVPPIVSLSCGW